VTALTVKLLGGGLLVLAGLLTGLRALREKRAAARRLRELAAALGRLRTELLETRAPLPEAFARLSREPFFALLSAGFGTERTETLWQRAAQTQPIPEEARAALASLGAYIGRCEAARQAEELWRVRELLLERSAALEREIAGRARQYPGLGAAAGAILAVMLF